MRSEWEWEDWNTPVIVSNITTTTMIGLVPNTRYQFRLASLSENAVSWHDMSGSVTCCGLFFAAVCRYFPRNGFLGTCTGGGPPCQALLRGTSQCLKSLQHCNGVRGVDMVQRMENVVLSVVFGT